MGCDIHWVLERKAPEKWIGVSCSRYNYSVAAKRWYDFFGELGHTIRAETDTAEALHGLPDDMSDLSAFEYEQWNIDAHTMSHLPLRSFNDAYRRAEKRCALVEPLKDIGDLFGKYFWPENEDDYRVVFWFDN